MAKGIKTAKIAPAAPLSSTVSGYVPVDQGIASGFGGTGGQPKTGASNGVFTVDMQYVDGTGHAVAHGYIISQKGASKYLVGNSAAVSNNIATVTLTNTDAGNLTVGQGSVVCYDTSSTAFYARRITTKHVYDFTGNKYIYKVHTPATATYANVASY